ncbi:MAG TPA: tetratricopeptide repeat protein, partial [Gemmatimonadota bacterium]|nr:tetratricopeptide repeat protein [Gemmatimonadota bacterium]
AQVAIYRGQLRHAIDILERGLDRDRRDGASGSAKAHKVVRLIEALAVADRWKECVERVRAFESGVAPNDPTGAVRDWLAALAAQLFSDGGRVEQLDSIVVAYRALQSEYTMADSINAHGVLAAAAMARGAYAAAIAHYVARAGDRLEFSSLYRLGLAHAASDRQRDAIRYYEQALDAYDQSRWDQPIESTLLHYHLGRAYERSGQPDKAVQQYERVTSIWSDADTELPELVDARSRLAALGA